MSTSRPSQEQIDQQKQLLISHRNTLSIRLNQQAMLGAAHSPPEVFHDIRQARDSIRRIKNTLHEWGVIVDEHPDDEDPTVPRRVRIFISYKHNSLPDESIAREVFAAFRHQHEVFIDEMMLVGTAWAKHIEDELGKADFLIAILSAQSIHSEMVKGEIEKAHHLGRVQNGRPTILPVRLNYREPFQYPLSAYLDPINWAFWSNPEDTPRLLEELHRVIAGGELSVGTTQSKAHLLRINPSPPIPQPTPSAQVAPLELPEGTMDTQSVFYIERRSCDPIVLETIQQPGVTITIKGPRQMGKSSLLIRMVAAARKTGKRVAFLDFQLFDQTALTHADLFFRQFCAWLTDELDLEDRVDEYWNMPLGNSQRCTRYIGRYVLKDLDSPLVLAMDEVERIFDTNFRSDFFSMLRSWHNSRAITPAWKNLDLALVTSTEPYQLIANLNQSPFNVGQVIELMDFDAEQVADLNRRHGLPLDALVERQLTELLGGHPYLVRRALYLIASKRISTIDLFAKATDDRGPFGDHLRYHLFRLHDKPDLIQCLLQVLRHNTCHNDDIFFRLRGAGLVRREGRTVLPRCQLYADYFRERLHG